MSIWNKFKTWVTSLFTKSEDTAMTDEASTTTVDQTVPGTTPATDATAVAAAAAAAATAATPTDATASEVADVAAAAAVAVVGSTSSTGAAVVAAVGPEMTDVLRKVLVSLGHDVTSVWDEAVALANAATKSA